MFDLGTDASGPYHREIATCYAKLAKSVIALAVEDLVSNDATYRQTAQNFFLAASYRDCLAFWCTLAGLSLDRVDRATPVIQSLSRQEGREALLKAMERGYTKPSP